MSPPTTGISHTALIQFFNSILPPAPNHLPLIYHSPRLPNHQQQQHHQAQQQPRITRIILSITATPSIYPLITPTTALFLHRPWNLVRRLLHRSTLVLTSHQRLDELLTTGYNEVLLRRLGVEGTMQGIVGYKGDPERKIGLVGRLPVRVIPREGEDEGRREYGEGGEVGRSTFEDWLDAIRHEFPDVETPTRTPNRPSLTEEPKDSLLPATTTMTINPELVPGPPQQSQPPPLYIACMNAFDPETIDRAIAAASALSLSHRDTGCPPDTTTATTTTAAAAAAANPPFHPSQIIYLTGQPRPLGLAHAHRTGIRPVFAGHRGAEAWAVRYVADCLRCQEWGDGKGEGDGEGDGGGVEVLVVDEPEEVVPRQGKTETRTR